jgi:hypothetical protein
MAAGVGVLTTLVLTWNVAVLDPPGMVMLEGTVVAGVPLTSWATLPPEGAGPFKVIVAVEMPGSITDVGLSVKEYRTTRPVVVRVAVWLTPPYVPVILTGVSPLPLETVVIVKLALVDPAGTVTVDGKDAGVELLAVNATNAPPVGAALFKVTVPILELPCCTDVGFNVSDEIETM